MQDDQQQRAAGPVTLPDWTIMGSLTSYSDSFNYRRLYCNNPVDCAKNI